MNYLKMFFDVAFNKPVADLLCGTYDALFGPKPPKPPDLGNTPGERIVYNYCVNHSYKESRKEILDDLWLIYTEADKLNLRPMKRNAFLRKEIFAKVARIHCKETMGKVIAAYELIHIHNTNLLKEENK